MPKESTGIAVHDRAIERLLWANLFAWTSNPKQVNALLKKADKMVKSGNRFLPVEPSDVATTPNGGESEMMAECSRCHGREAKSSKTLSDWRHVGQLALSELTKEAAQGITLDREGGATLCGECRIAVGLRLPTSLIGG